MRGGENVDGAEELAGGCRGFFGGFCGRGLGL